MSRKKVEEKQLPEYLHDRGLDRVPIRFSQGNAVVQASHYNNYRSIEHLDTNGNGSQQLEWLEEDVSNEGKVDEDAYPGEDGSSNVVHDYVSSILW